MLHAVINAVYTQQFVPLLSSKPDRLSHWNARAGALAGAYQLSVMHAVLHARRLTWCLMTVFVVAINKSSFLSQHKVMDPPFVGWQQVPRWNCRIASRCSLRYLSALTGTHSQPACRRRYMSQAAAASEAGAGTQHASMTSCCTCVWACCMAGMLTSARQGQACEVDVVTQAQTDAVRPPKPKLTANFCRMCGGKLDMQIPAGDTCWPMHLG